MSSNRDRYGRRRVKPKIRFQFRKIVLIYFLCVLAGLVAYMVKVNL